MRHGKKINHLSRTSSHRKAMLSNMASSLISEKRIITTLAKAKALRKFVEPLITKAKNNTTHSRRTVMSYLQNKESVTTLYGEVAGRVGTRPGGYTRIIKLGQRRLGDAAAMCMMELVDFNDVYKKDSVTKKAKTRRSRSKSGKETTADVTTQETSATETTAHVEEEVDKKIEKKEKKEPKEKNQKTEGKNINKKETE